ncbi:iron-containing alcohol dehydrogenase [Candidatus Flexifilum breve]|uniref:iron-containing alcohol dehydrogenase n=1 Tax=Candidatus Flexifilum breve TaxID=3140694 RepID=UPI0031CCC087
MNFEFATATRIALGAGKLNEIGGIAAEYGARALVVTSSVGRAQPLLDRLDAAKISYSVFEVISEPDITLVSAGVRQYHKADAQFVIGMGGGSAIDAGKA